MASIHKRATGPKAGTSILTFYRDGKPHVIYLGKVSDTTAKDTEKRVEFLLGSLSAGSPLDPDTARWLGKIGDKLHAKLANAGLVEPRETREQSEAATLGPFLDGYLASRSDVKHWTKTNCRQARNNLVTFFGADKPLADIAPGDADEWRLWLGREPKEGVPVKKSGRGLSENTLRRHCGRAKQFFEAAVRKRLIAESPFADMKDCLVKSNRERDYFVTREEADKVLAACPSTQWKLVFALSRYGGLRCPSEHSALKWSDIDWERGRFTVHSSKTEHHEGKDKREVPLFAELRPYLEAAKAEAAKGGEYVITLPGVVECRGNEKASNLGTTMAKIVRKAGLEPWPKLFHNLRASRQIELAATHPEHVVCEWIGNSKAVAREHYLRVTDADFDRAGSKDGSKVGQINGQLPAIADDGLLLQIVQKALEKCGTEQFGAIVGKALQQSLVPREGLEPSTL